MELLAYSALLTPFPQMKMPEDTSVWKHQILRMGTLGSAASLILLSSLPAKAIVTQGSTCNAVQDIQEALTAKKYDVGGVDGIFGPKTYAAILKFQTDQKLQADGIVGVKTAEALGLSGAVYASGATCEASSNTETPRSKAATPTTPTPNQATSKQQYTITAEALNVRSGPGSSYEIVDVLFKDNQVEVTSAQSGWLEIEKGKWISAQFAQQKSVSEQSTREEATSKAKPVTVASESGTTTEEPSRVTLIDIKDLDPALTTGFVQVVVEAINVRAEPTLGNNIVGYVAKDEILPLTGKATADGWIQVGWGDWISSAFVEPVSLEAFTNEAQPSSTTAPDADSETTAEESSGVTFIDIKDLDPTLTTGFVQVVAEAVNVRAQPTLGNNIVGYVAKDEILPLTGKATQDGWIQVAWGDWISSGFVKPVVLE